MVVIACDTQPVVVRIPQRQVQQRVAIARYARLSGLPRLRAVPGLQRFGAMIHGFKEGLIAFKTKKSPSGMVTRVSAEKLLMA